MSVTADLFSMYVSAPSSSNTQGFLQRLTQQTRSVMPEHIVRTFDQLKVVQNKVLNYASQAVVDTFKFRQVQTAMPGFSRHDTLLNIRSAETKDLRVIMAQPKLQAYYQLGLADGFGGDYEGTEKNTIPEKRRDYLLATNGIAGMNGKDYNFHTYWDSAMTKDDIFSTPEKINILECWAAINNAIVDGDDPSSRLNASF